MRRLLVLVLFLGCSSPEPAPAPAPAPSPSPEAKKAPPAEEPGIVLKGSRSESTPERRRTPAEEARIAELERRARESQGKEPKEPAREATAEATKDPPKAAPKPAKKPSKKGTGWTPDRAEKVAGLKGGELRVVNETPYDLTIDTEGPAMISVAVAPGETKTRAFPAGSYRLTAFVSAEEVQPYEGTFEVEDGHRYHSTFKIVTKPR